MKPRRSRRFAATLTAIGVLAAGCSRDEELATETLEPPIEPGGVCGTTTAHCLGESSLLSCKGRLWTEESCSSVCAQTGRVAIGCFDRAYGDECLCAAPDAGRTADAGSCSAGRHCAGPDSIDYCDRYGPRSRSCADICSELVPPRRTAGCVAGGALGILDDCACTFEGMPCGDEPTEVCDGPSRLARCLDGGWTFSDCREQCPADQQASCGSWAGDAGAACRCEP